MRVRVRLLPSGQERSIDLEEGARGIQLMDALKLNPDAHIIIRGDGPVPIDSALNEDDQLSVVSVISGG